MTHRKARIPMMEERLDNVKHGVLDHTGDSVPFFELEDWEVRGEPPAKPPAPRRTRKRKAQGVTIASVQGSSPPEGAD